MRSLALAFVVLAAAACGDGSSGTPDMTVAPDLKTGPDMFDSICGKPGDTGNSFGVGKYCEEQSDCAGTAKQTLCSTLGNPRAHFCTFICDPMMANPCGDGATCQCDGGLCGCTPNACLGSPGDGGMNVDGGTSG